MFTVLLAVKATFMHSDGEILALSKVVKRRQADGFCSLPEGLGKQAD